MDPDRFTVVDEPLPGAWLSRASAKRAGIEAQFIRAMRDHVGWKELEAAWAEQERSYRKQLFAGKSTEDAIVGMQCAIEWLKEPGRIAGQIEDHAKDAADWLEDQLASEKRRGKPMLRMRSKRFTNATAAEFMKRATAMRQMLELPGWKILVRRMAARAWAHYEMMQTDKAEDVARHKRAILACVAALRIVQLALDLGEDAEVWQQEQAEETEKKEAADA